MMKRQEGLIRMVVGEGFSHYLTPSIRVALKIEHPQLAIFCPTIRVPLRLTQLVVGGRFWRLFRPMCALR